jgi:hypothetical protein
MLRDRGDLLKYALSHALKDAAKYVRGLRTTLPVAERERVADAAVDIVRKLPDDPWKLAEPLPQYSGPMKDLGAPTPEGWFKKAGES